MGDCLIKLHQMMDQFSPAEQRVAQYLYENTMDVLSMSIGQVAAACDTSSTTVVRLCKQLEYKGYKELCMSLSSDLAHGMSSRIHYEDVMPGANLDDILCNVTEHNQRAIADTVRLITPDTFSVAVDTLLAAPRIDCYGVGMSGVVAMDGQQKFLRLGKISQTSLDSHVQVVMAASLQKGDAVILFSYSGETTDMLDTLHEIRKTEATVISVTRYRNTPLSRLADIPLFVAATETLVRSAAMSSRISMMHLVDLLYTAMTTKAYDGFKPMLDRTHLAGKEKRKSQRERRK